MICFSDQSFGIVARFFIIRTFSSGEHCLAKTIYFRWDVIIKFIDICNDFMFYYEILLLLLIA